MDRFARAVQGVVQFLQEAVDRDWRSPEERRYHSALQGPWFDEVAGWLEQFAGHEIWQTASERMDEVRAFSRGVRDELGLVLSRMEPQLATAVLCGLPASQSLGYAPERLAASLGVEVGQVFAWEMEGYARMRAFLNERTPLLAFLLALAVEQEQDRVDKDSQETGVPGAGTVGSETNVLGAGFVRPEQHEQSLEPEQVELLLHEARSNPDFDLRRYVTPAEELEWRQWFHKWGVESQFPEAEAEGRELAVALVQERMKLEMSVGVEETEDA